MYEQNEQMREDDELSVSLDEPLLFTLILVLVLLLLLLGNRCLDENDIVDEAKVVVLGNTPPTASEDDEAGTSSRS